MILLRHGQSEFNLHFSATRRDPGIIDPPLTPLGHTQAAQAAAALSGLGIVRIITSPYTRALQTTAPIAAALGVPVAVVPIVRERFGYACDIGSPRAELARAWPEHDFSALDEIWWPVAEEPREQVARRAERFRAEISGTPDWSRTLIISHWGFILALTGQSISPGQWLRHDPTRPPAAAMPDR